ncbi:dihydropyrimidinase [Desulfuribacillus stibiiarsenatis]|uniref:Dihydropyrimidinase n=2 Tax=Desulfuribacillus stibiiarsenatis TaxID=1390249 RepID=A0A1E5L3F3_9FIRM|nr:dihydropyrimidinase [Desulfuribacillus stibiiarsenatis]
MGRYSLLLKGGTVVTADETKVTDIGVYKGMVVALGDLDPADAKEVIDVTGKYVMPGAIDVHTHLDMPSGNYTTSDNFFTGTKAAAFGGTTTIIDFAIQEHGKSLKEAVDVWTRKANNRAVIDYGFHIIIKDIHDGIIEEMRELAEMGFPSFKLFMTYDSLRVSDDVILKVFEVAKEVGAIVLLHAENHEIIKYLVEKHVQEGKVEPRYHALSKPDYTEVEAVVRASNLARAVDAPVYLVHVSSPESIKYINELRNTGTTIFAETCPQYLLLDDSMYDEQKHLGAKYIMSPPLRSKERLHEMWAAISNGSFQVLATDHCPFPLKKKIEQAKKDFSQVPNGMPGIQLRLMLAYTYGVLSGRLTMQDLVRICSTNPARIFGLYPNKGTIKISSDADLIVFDPTIKGKINMELIRENIDYTPYEGMGFQGLPTYVFSRGKTIIDNLKFVGKKGTGVLIKRKKFSLGE